MAARKLTLSVDERVIAAAKTYAQEQGTSVSRLVEGFLRTVSAPPVGEVTTPVLDRLRGSMNVIDPAQYGDHLADKYL